MTASQIEIVEQMERQGYLPPRRARDLADALLIARNALEALRPLPLVIDGRVGAIIAQADAALSLVVKPEKTKQENAT